MNTNIYRILISLAVLPLLITSCYEDKGNYTYTVPDEVTITLPERIAALTNAGYIEFTPTVVSKLDGEIKADNPDYEFGAKINYSHKNDEDQTELWLDIDEEKTMSVKYFAAVPANDYKLWYTVTNKKTGVTYSAMGTVSIGSTTYNGWMVLSNNGPQNKARLDNIFTNAEGNPQCAYDLLGPDAPEITDAVGLHFYPSIYSTNDVFGKQESVYLLSHSGSYRLLNSTLVTRPEYSIKNLEYILNPEEMPGEPIAMANVYVYSNSASGKLLLTDAGNLYKISSNTAGTCFEDPINTENGSITPAYKLAPFIGVGMNRPGNSATALLYDETNKRFLYWYVYDAATLKPCKEPDSDAKFSYSPGMDLIYMESTRFASNVVYNIMRDNAGERHIYAINMSGFGNPTQEAVYDNITAPHFNDADKFAFHSQYPFMFYAYGDRIYCYNLTTGQVLDEISLPGEEITRIKFNLFQNSVSSTATLRPIEDRQWELIVGSGNGQPDGGKVRFFTISEQGKASLHEEFSGFGEKVVDVLYRERP